MYSSHWAEVGKRFSGFIQDREVNSPTSGPSEDTLQSGDGANFPRDQDPSKWGMEYR